MESSAEAVSRRLAQPSENTAGEARRPLLLLFALPPNVEGYGELRIPSGLMILASLAEQAGWATDFLVAVAAGATRTCPSDCLLEPEPGGPAVRSLAHFTDRLIERLMEHAAAGWRPALALSCFSSSLYLPTMLSAVCVREHFPRLPILVGGYHPTIDPQSMVRLIGTEAGPAPQASLWHQDSAVFIDRARRATATVRATQDHVFDYVFRGRAERVFLDVVRTLSEGRERSEASEVVEPRGYDADELRAFRYSPEVLARLAGPPGVGADDALERGFDLCFSVGCPHSCAFCINSTRHEPWQGMDVDSALQILQFLHLEHGVSRFSIMDANFAADRRWRRRFFEQLADKPWSERVQLDIQASVSSFDFTDPQLIGRFGLTLQVGVESCSPEILLRMEKTRDPERYRSQLREMIETMAPRVDLMGLLMIFGYPGESRRTLRESLAFLLEDCRVLDHPNVAIVPQLYLPLVATEAARRTAEYRRDLGFEAPGETWWVGEAGRRFDGMRPSRELGLESCFQLASVIVDYYFGAAGVSGRGGEAPVLTVKSKLEKRRLRDTIGYLLAE